jgi:hypothetical protein
LCPRRRQWHRDEFLLTASSLTNNTTNTEMHRTHYIFIDFENVQETDLDRIANKAVKVTLVLGERHKSLPLHLVKLIQKYPTQVQLVETVLNGKNALDFVLACEMGVASERTPMVISTFYLGTRASMRWSNI